MADDIYPLTDLQENIEEIEQHQKLAPQRLRAFYSEEEEPPTNFSQLPRPPHQTMIENAAEWALMTRNQFDDRRVLGEGPPLGEFEYLALGVATERFLNAIYLLKNTDQFIQHLEDNGKTPDYEDAEKILIKDLTIDLDSSQIRRIKLILKIVRLHRNNIAHFGFHRLTVSKHMALIYQVLAFLFQRYSSESLDVVDELLKYYDRAHRIPEEYGHIDFPFDEE